MRAPVIICLVALAGCKDNSVYCDTDEQCVQRAKDGIATDGDDGDGSFPAKLKVYCHPSKHYCYAGCVVDANCQDTSRRMNVGQAYKSHCNTATHHCEANTQDDGGLDDGGLDDGGPADLRHDLHDGEGCSDPAECKSGNCTDGVCCDSPCEGDCVACDFIGQMGTCLTVPTGQDPSGDCRGELPLKPCDGTCDGKGACAFPGKQTGCSESTCQDLGGDSLVVHKRCDGKGTCAEGSPESCGGFKCGSDGCRHGCSGSWECHAGFTCDNNRCTNPQPNGTACGTNDAACATKLCIDGVCCATACSGKCRRCNLPGSEGTCSSIPASQDPDSECGGDPGCEGACDGAGGCTYPSSETECAYKCGAQGKVPAIERYTCVGQGSCSSAPVYQLCGFGKCLSGTTPQCADGCTDHGDCITGSVCDRTQAHLHPLGRGQCIDPKKVTSTGPMTGIGGPIYNIPGDLYIRISAGTYKENVIIGGSRKIMLFADGAATLDPSADGPAISISGGAQVSVQGLVIKGATGSDGQGIRCRESMLTVVESTIESNESLGISAFDGNATLRRNTIRKNKGGGLSVGYGKLTIVNNLLVLNGLGGPGGSMVGGIQLNSATSTTLTNNTIGYNSIQDGAIAGIYCDTGAIKVRNSILWGNLSSAQYALCSLEHSTVQGGASGTGNKDTDPSFDASYKPQAASCIDAGNSSAAGLGSIDIAGKPRKQGAAVDMGALEVK